MQRHHSAVYSFVPGMVHRPPALRREHVAGHCGLMHARSHAPPNMHCTRGFHGRTDGRTHACTHACTHAHLLTSKRQHTNTHNTHTQTRRCPCNQVVLLGPLGSSHVIAVDLAFAPATIAAGTGADGTSYAVVQDGQGMAGLCTRWVGRCDSLGGLHVVHVPRACRRDCCGVRRCSLPVRVRRCSLPVRVRRYSLPVRVRACSLPVRVRRLAYLRLFRPLKCCVL